MPSSEEKRGGENRALDHTVGMAISVLPSASSVACAICALRNARVGRGARKLRPPSSLIHPPIAFSTQIRDGLPEATLTQLTGVLRVKVRAGGAAANGDAGQRDTDAASDASARIRHRIRAFKQRPARCRRQSPSTASNSPGKRSSISCRRSVFSLRLPCSCCSIRPASRSTRKWWVDVDLETLSANPPHGTSPSRARRRTMLRLTGSARACSTSDRSNSVELGCVGTATPAPPLFDSHRTTLYNEYRICVRD